MPPDWDRVLFYSRRIKELGVYDGDAISFNVDAVVYKFLSIYRPTTSIFPQLRSLGCGAIDMLAYIHIFLGPMLDKLVLASNMQHQLHIGRLFTSLKHTSPSLKVLKMSFSHLNIAPTVDTQLSELLSSLPRLQILHCIPFCLSQQSLTVLSKLPDLQDLRLTLTADPGTRLFWAGFPALARIHVQTKDLQNVASLIRVITSKELWLVEVTLDEIPKASLLEDFFSSLAHHPSRLELSHVSVKTLHTAPPVPLTGYLHKITAHTFRPLLALKSTSSLEISIACCYSIDDDLIKAMAAAWPKLEILNLLPPLGRLDSIEVSLVALISLIKHCKNLANLSLAFDLTEIETSDEQRPSQGNSLELETLDVGNSPIDSPARVALLLSDLFGRPDIESLEDGDDPVQTKRYKRWTEVGHLISYFAEARDQERNHEGSVESNSHSTNGDMDADEDEGGGTEGQDGGSA